MTKKQEEADMRCPVCATTDLMMTERQGVEIDYCPQCRGVWLDRGELDKIIERSTVQQVQQVEPAPQRYREPEQPVQYQKRGHDDDDYGYRQQHGNGQYGQHKKKSLLSELFDF
jgi:Zn-finger nucleic acid-binding protein